jgi:hypothetical protein
MSTLHEIVDAPLIQAREEAERAAIINALVADDFERGDASKLLEHFLRWGFDGYENVNTYDLCEEMKTRGLTI